jgi:4-nitrophenyl phosphatase
MKNNLKFPEDKQVYVVGMSGICEELESMNIKYCGSSNDNSNIEDMAHIGSMKLDENVGAVLLGFDLDINYKKYAKAFTYLLDPNCKFLATNSDLTYPAGRTIFPGTGALLAALTAPLKRDPIILYSANPIRQC